VESRHRSVWANAAAAWRVDPMLVDVDYALGCLLSQWTQEPGARGLRFKGGTCLRKCYFFDYRFSEDLDFTGVEGIGVERVKRLAQGIIRRVRDVFGLDLAAAPPLVKSMVEEDEEVSIEARLYYRGPLRRTGDPRAIRLHISSQEHLAFPPTVRSVMHPYEDALFALSSTVVCCDLREVLAEKVRAISGRRKHAISLDLYDLHWLLTRGGLSLSEVDRVLRVKFEAKGLRIGSVSAREFRERMAEFERDWSQNLSYLVPYTMAIRFEDAWATAVRVVEHVAGSA